MKNIYEILDEIEEGWIYVIDDDNKIHEDFYISISKRNLVKETRYNFLAYDRSSECSHFSLY